MSASWLQLSYSDYYIGRGGLITGRYGPVTRVGVAFTRVEVRLNYRGKRNVLCAYTHVYA